MSGVANMAAGISSMNRLRASIASLPVRIRSAVAKDAAEVLTAEVRESFSAGSTVYDTPRPLSVDGAPLTLVKSGRTKADLVFVAIGTIVRAQLGTKYAKFLVGKYKVLPSSLPAAWRAKLEQLVGEYVADFAKETAR